jgi:hypothetical protein
VKSRFDFVTAAAIPTRAEYLEVFAPAIVATCRSILNTSTPVRTIGEFVSVSRDDDDTRPRRRARKCPARDRLGARPFVIARGRDSVFYG